MPSLDNVEEYLASMEEYFHSSFTAVTHSLPGVHEVVNQLWIDISRYGPGMPAFPEVHIPSLGDFHVPPPPPPPPPACSAWISCSTDWVANHPWKASGVLVGVVGTGLLVGYRSSFSSRQRRLYAAQKAQTTERRQIVGKYSFFVLGGDTPYAEPLLRELEKKGYIVIASVSTPEGVDAIESKCHGYVKCHVLDPFAPSTIPIFLRSLSATLSRKFPINSPGDPFASPSSLPYIHSIVSLLTLSAPVPSATAPLEHISLRDTYLPYITASQIAPLQIIQALLPLLRTGSARSRDTGKKSIVICLPATDARVGLPFSAVKAMSAAGTLRGVEVLRREIGIAALTERSDSMENIKVVVVDVGAFDIGQAAQTLHPEGIYKSMEDWSASEKVVYGPAFISVMQEKPHLRSVWDRLKSAFKQNYYYGLPRKPTNLTVFADNLIEVVSGGRYGPSIFGFGLGLGLLRRWIRGDRFSVGAGASTYKLASHLPSLILDGLLAIPHFLISLRNRLLLVQPFRDPSEKFVLKNTTAKDGLKRQPKEGQEAGAEIDSNSDADLESNTGDNVDSWVSLNKKSSDA